MFLSVCFRTVKGILLESTYILFLNDLNAKGHPDFFRHFDYSVSLQYILRAI